MQTLRPPTPATKVAPCVHVPLHCSCAALPRASLQCTHERNCHLRGAPELPTCGSRSAAFCIVKGTLTDPSAKVWARPTKVNGYEALVNSSTNCLAKPGATWLSCTGIRIWTCTSSWARSSTCSRSPTGSSPQTPPVAAAAAARAGLRLRLRTAEGGSSFGVNTFHSQASTNCFRSNGTAAFGWYQKTRAGTQKQEMQRGASARG